MAFVHLHTHTENSLLDGLARMNDAFVEVAADGQTACAITDHGTLGGIWKAKKAAKSAGVKLIPGEEFYLALNSDGTLGNRHDPGVMETTDVGDDSDGDDAGVKKKRYYHLTVIAYNRAGWNNLVKVANASEHTKFGKYPMADMALFKEHSEGLIALTGCLGGPVLGPVAHGDTALARTNLASVIDAFGKANVYVEVMEHGIRPETLAMPAMKEIADEFGTPVVATNDAHYTRAEDAVTHDAWLALRTKAMLDDPKRYRFSGSGFHLRTEAEMSSLFAADRPGEPNTLLNDEPIRRAMNSMRSELLRPMLRPASWSDAVWAEVSGLPGEYEAAYDEFLSKNSHAAAEIDAERHAAVHVRGLLALMSAEAREFVARTAREADYLQEFGRPALNPHHPRNWWNEAVACSGKIAERVADDVVPEGKPKLPKFPTPEGYASNRQFLAHLVNEGATRLYGAERPKNVSERLTYEWDVVDGMGFVDYFLIDHDFVAWAKGDKCVHRANSEAVSVTSPEELCSVGECDGTKKPILVGPGRGSAAGSLIAYVLGITGIDPLEHDLLFERFLEPGRSDFPDIDIDFETNRRDDVILYLTHRWGEGHVALIGTYGVSKTRRSIRDAARLLDESSIGNALAKVIPVVQGQPMGFADLMDENNPQTAEFRRELEKAGERGKAVFELASGFAETINGASIHACGVVISDLYLPDLIPLRTHKNGYLITQWDSKDIESFGLIKFDVLALRNLDIAHTAMDYIFDLTGEQLSIETIPHPSTKGDVRVDRAWALLREGRTAGIFQMEGDAMTALAQDVQPDGIDDLSAILALFRPGPISAGMPEHYGLRKNGKEAVDYFMYTSDPTEQAALASRLGSTYALMVYQEQLMLLGTTIAGFDTTMRSKLRKAIGKKNKDLMAQVKDVFLSGAEQEFLDDDGTVISPVFSRDTAERLWEFFKGNADYQFNASHSYAYAYLAYWTAFLKANWPGAYGAAILANTSDKAKRGLALRALPAEGIEVLPPDVNASLTRSTPDGMDKVRLGLGEVAGVGEAGERVVSERTAAGHFTSLKDLAHRVRVDDIGAKHLPSGQLVGLIESGALDAFGTRMGLTMMARMAANELPAPVPEIEWGIIERAARQRQRLGVSIGEHPLRIFQDQVKLWSKKILDEDGRIEFEEKATAISQIPSDNGTPVTTIGLLANWSEGSYRGGRKAAITLEGSRDRIEGVMWDRELGRQKEMGIPPIGWPVAVSGKVTVREFEQEDEFGSITLQVVRQLTINRVDVVDIVDPLHGGLDREVVVPVLTDSDERWVCPATAAGNVQVKAASTAKSGTASRSKVTGESAPKVEVTPDGDDTPMVFFDGAPDVEPPSESAPEFEPASEPAPEVEPASESASELAPSGESVREPEPPILDVSFDDATTDESVGFDDVPAEVATDGAVIELTLTLRPRFALDVVKALAAAGIDEPELLDFTPKFTSTRKKFVLKRDGVPRIQLTLV